MGIQAMIGFQIVGYILLIYVVYKLIRTFFRIAKSLEGIDETLYKINIKLEDKNNSKK